MSKQLIEARGVNFTDAMMHANMRETAPKTQTRRLIKPWPADVDEYDCPYIQVPVTDPEMPGMTFHDRKRIECPYGKVGDLLYTRATYGYFNSGKFDRPEWGTTFRWNWDGRGAYEIERWRPAMHQFRKDTQMVMRITEVRAERVGNISQEDALREGIVFDRAGGFYHVPNSDPDIVSPYSARHCYALLWAAIHGQPTPVYEKKADYFDKAVVKHYVCYPFESHPLDGQPPFPTEHRGKPLIVVPNPWVWVISYERVTDESIIELVRKGDGKDDDASND